MFCKNCGAVVSGRFCSCCGTKIRNGHEEAQLAKNQAKRVFVRRSATDLRRRIPAFNRFAWEIAEAFLESASGNNFTALNCPGNAAEVIEQEATVISSMLRKLYWTNKEYYRGLFHREEST